MGAGINGVRQQPDPGFLRYSELQRDLSKLQDIVQDSVSEYFNKLLVNTPPNDPPEEDADIGMELANLISSGAFFPQDVSITPDENIMNTMIQAPIISELWNEQKIYVLRIPPDHLDLHWSNGVAGPAGRTYDWRYDPCNGEDGSSADHRDARKEPPRKHVVCDPNDGTNYLVLRWTDSTYDAYGDDFGFDDELLGNYGLNKEMITLAAVNTWRRTESFMPRGTDHLTGLFNDVAAMADLDRDKAVANLIQFNIPVCDLGQVEKGKFDWTFKFGDSPCVQGLDGIHTADCLLNMARENCHKTWAGDQQWPY